MQPPQHPPGRLDGWKNIAAYLGRDVRTLKRWERNLGLPVRRVSGGRGSSVFAYPAELDEWLKNSRSPSRDETSIAIPPERSNKDAALEKTDVRAAPRSSRVVLWSSLAAVAILGAALGWRALDARVRVDDLRLTVTRDAVTALLADGSVRWRYQFPSGYDWSLPHLDMAPPTAGRDPQVVYVATQAGQRHSDAQIVSGVLTELDARGAPRRSFAFNDTVSLGGRTYGPPWAITSYAVGDSAATSHRIAVAAHHWVWNASLVTVLDDRWKRLGTFVNDGWVESVRWLAPSRLLIAGFSNSHDGGMVALLDPTRAGGVRGQGPETPGSAGYCDSCGSAIPLRVVILPRSPLNRARASEFNRAVLEVIDGRVIAHTFETPPTAEGVTVAEAIYEFSPTLELLHASYSDGYREIARALEASGKLPASFSKRGAEHPAFVEVWDPASGWTKVDVREP